MNHLIHLQIPTEQFDQLVKAVTLVNTWYHTPTSAPICSIKISGTIEARMDEPEKYKCYLRYRDVWNLFEISKYFGIILEKVTPQSL